MKQKLYRYWILFLTFLKIGLFTFGGGYAMIPLIQKEIVGRKKWLTDPELMDVLVIAESTPGPVSVNSATYVGYKTAGITGSVVATFGLVLPSFIIIFIISLFFDDFMKIRWVQSAFLGIQAAVAVLIISAGTKLFKNTPKSVYNIVAVVAVFVLSVVLKFLKISFSSIWFILIGAMLGLCYYLIDLLREKRTKTVFKAADEDSEAEKQDDLEEEDKR